MSLQFTERQLPTFELRFADRLNPNHGLLRAAELIDWDSLQRALSKYYSPLGRSGKPIRLMVGIHILKHRFNSSDERAVEELHENAYWQCFCGFEIFQTAVLLEPTSLVKSRNRLGAEGMKQIEAVLLLTWRQMDLVKTEKIAADITAQPKNIAYPADVDLLRWIREKIVQKVRRVREEVTLRKPFLPFHRISKRVVLGVKKFYRRDPEKRAKATQKLRNIVTQVIYQANWVAHTLYVRKRKDLARPLHQLTSLGLKIVEQTGDVLQGQKSQRRLYPLHEPAVAAIGKGKSHPDCEFASVVSLALNEDGLILGHQEYQRNVADVKTLDPLLKVVQINTGVIPQEIGADRGFSRSLPKERRWCRRLGVKRLAIPRKGKRPHPDRRALWCRRVIRRRVAVEPVIGHLKQDHRMSRCRYKGWIRDTINVAWASLALNTKKLVFLNAPSRSIGKLNPRKYAYPLIFFNFQRTYSIKNDLKSLIFQDEGITFLNPGLFFFHPALDFRLISLNGFALRFLRAPADGAEQEANVIYMIRNAKVGSNPLGDTGTGAKVSEESGFFACSQQLLFQCGFISAVKPRGTTGGRVSLGGHLRRRPQ